MTAVVHMVRPTSAHTFRDYVSQHLVPSVESQVTPTVTRVDVVWVTYPEDNLKTLTHQHRGLGPRTRIGDGNTRIPKQDRKKTAWSAWQSIPDLTDTLVALTNYPQELSLLSQYMQTLERFVVLIFSKGCGLVKINEAGLRLQWKEVSGHLATNPGSTVSAHPQGNPIGHCLESSNVSPYGHP